MAEYDQTNNTYTLGQDEEDFTVPGAPPGGPNAIVIGNALANVIIGNAGDNSIEGGDGADNLSGGDGNDTLVGGGLADILTGGIGTDTLDGGSGDDLMAGGADADIYYVDNENDEVYEEDEEGIDTVFASVSYSLSSQPIAYFVEDLVLQGTGDLSGTGNALANKITGNSGNNIIDGGGGIDEMIGGAGNDTYIVDNVNDVVTEEGDEGHDTVRSSVSFTLVNTAIEDLILTGTAGIDGTGNHLDNRIEGNAHINILDGREGNDTIVGSLGDELIGGEGDDLFIVSSSDISVTEQGTAGSGNDTIESSVSFDLSLVLNVENLTLTGTGAINATGDDLANVITGNDAANTLNGKGGVDQLVGGKGNDTYIIDASDVLVEAEDGGTDTIEITDAYGPAEYTLGEFFENLTLRGSRALNGTGNAANNVITGNGGQNVLSGLDGNDVLDGGAGTDRLLGDAGEDTLIGGVGDDVMIGGAGNDLYLVDSASDVVTEEAGGGNFDRVVAKVNHTLAANIEYLALDNAGGNINATGNNLDNTIFGNSGNNVLDGGTGRDQLYGATGDDTVYGGDGDDTIHESGDGSDVLNGGNGNDDIRAEGGNDLLDGGSGADQLKGGTGDDTYMVDDALDVIVETVGEGTDKVTAKISFSLAAGAAVEQIAATAGSSVIDLTGNEFANAITGNDGANGLAGGIGDDILEGGAGNDKLRGGLGKDTLKGGMGKDVFVFDTIVDKTKTQIDRIDDYKIKDDSIWLDNAVFTKLGKKGTEAKPAKLNSAFFTIGAKAKDKNDYLVYNKNTGKLYYDGDGSGAKIKAVEIATLSKKLGLNAAEFLII